MGFVGVMVGHAGARDEVVWVDFWRRVCGEVRVEF